jgi:hypothetical protein
VTTAAGETTAGVTTAAGEGGDDGGDDAAEHLGDRGDLGRGVVGRVRIARSLDHDHVRQVVHRVGSRRGGDEQLPGLTGLERRTGEGADQAGAAEARAADAVTVRPACGRSVTTNPPTAWLPTLVTCRCR